MSHERVSLEVLEQGEGFARRHIGPSKTDKQAMIKALGLASMDDLVERVVPSGIMSQAPLAGERPHRATGVGRSAHDSGQEQSLQANDRYGLLQLPYAQRHSAECSRKPCLVHRVHAVSARNLARSSGGAPQFPDDGRRSHRDGDRECLVTRRGHGGSRSHGLMPEIEREQQGLLCLVAMPPADNRSGSHPRRADRGRGDRR